MKNFLMRLFNKVTLTDMKSVQSLPAASSTLPSLTNSEKYKLIQKLSSYSFESLRENFENRTYDYDCLSKLTTGYDDLRLINWIGSMSYSGYTREKCLHFLISDFSDGDESPIFLRLSDWVKPVREAACSWVIDNFSGFSAERVFRNQRILLFLSRKEQLTDNRAMLKLIRLLLDAVARFTHEEFLSLSLQFRKFVLKQSIEGDGLLRERIVVDPDPSVRRLLLKSSLNLNEEEKSTFRNDKSVSLRRLFYSQQISRGEQPERDELIILALDRNRGIRQFAQFYLRQFYEEFDSYEFYKSRSGDQFYFITDYAKDADVEHFIRGVESGSAKVRENSIRALVINDSKLLQRVDIPKLLLDNMRIRTIVYEYMPTLFSVDEIIGMRYCFTDKPKGVIILLGIIERISFWNFVNCALAEILSDPNEELCQYVTILISRKKSLFEPLTDELKKSICDSLHSCSHRSLMSESAAVLEFIMR